MQWLFYKLLLDKVFSAFLNLYTFTLKMCLAFFSHKDIYLLTVVLQLIR